MGDARSGPLPVPAPGGIVFTEDDLTVRLLTDADVQHMVRWLGDPRVAQWYEGRDRVFDERAVRERFLRPGDPVWRCAIGEAGRPIGYLQMYEADEGHPAREGVPDAERVCGIDLFIGEPTLWDAGPGHAPGPGGGGVPPAGMGCRPGHDRPSGGQRPGHPGYEKAGFRKARLLPRHERREGSWRDAWLMEFEGSGQANHE